MEIPAKTGFQKKTECRIKTGMKKNIVNCQYDEKY